MCGVDVCKETSPTLCQFCTTWASCFAPLGFSCVFLTTSLLYQGNAAPRAREVREAEIRDIRKAALKKQNSEAERRRSRRSRRQIVFDTGDVVTGSFAAKAYIWWMSVDWWKIAVIELRGVAEQLQLGIMHTSPVPCFRVPFGQKRLRT